MSDTKADDEPLLDINGNPLPPRQSVQIPSASDPAPEPPPPPPPKRSAPPAKAAAVRPNKAARPAPAAPPPWEIEEEARFDLAGNPLPPRNKPLPTPQAPALPPKPRMAGYDLPGMEGERLDLAGNPLPPLSSAPPGPPLPPLPPPKLPPGAKRGNGESALIFAAGIPDEAARAQTRMRVGWALGIFVLLAVAAAFFFLFPKHAAAPKSFVMFTAKDKSYSCAQPVGWIITRTAGGVQFREASAHIDIETDVAIPPRTGSYATVLHTQWKPAVAAAHKGYTETPVASFQSRLGSARLAEWTANGPLFGLGGKIHGYRASIAGKKKTADVVCQCLDSDWPALKPAFLRVISSIRESSPAGLAAP